MPRHAGLLLFVNTPYQGPDWSVEHWLERACFPDELTSYVCDWGSPKDEVAVLVQVRNSGQGYQGISLRARVVSLRKPGLVEQLRVFKHGAPVGGSGGSVLPRRSLLLGGVPEEPDYCSVCHDRNRRQELSPLLFWQLVEQCWLPGRPEQTINNLANAILMFLRTASEEARAASKAAAASHKKPDQCYPLFKKHVGSTARGLGPVPTTAPGSKCGSQQR